jgi:hypothetical protein
MNEFFIKPNISYKLSGKNWSNPAKRAKTQLHTAATTITKALAN